MSQHLPNLVIIGAMKCGTTSLHNYLKLHPQIYMASAKELDFFIKKRPFYRKGLSWYESNFNSQEAEGKDIVGEASPNYTKCHAFPGVPECMHEVIPNAKLIYILRDPVKRAVSHYLHQYIARYEHREVNEAFQTFENNHYVQSSRYGFQLEQFLPYYNLENIFVTTLEELSSNRTATLQKIFKFLEVDANFQHPDFLRVHHQSSIKRRRTNIGAQLYSMPQGSRLCKLFSQIAMEPVEKPVLTTQTEFRLREFFQSDIEKLNKLTQQDFSALLGGSTAGIKLSEVKGAA